MPNVDTLVYILTGAFTFIVVLGGVIWKLIRDEAKEQAVLIKTKADVERLHEVEGRFQMELNAVREGNEKLVSKLEVRHDREIEQMATRLGEQIKTTEANILNQLRLMFEMVKGKTE
jgi:hypothetical protein